MTLVVRFVTELAILAILSLIAILYSGCISGFGYSQQDRVTLAAREYNNGVRWGRLEQAAMHLQQKERKHFYDQHKDLEDDLEIADCEMVSLELDKSDKKHPRAIARVEYTWSLKTVGLVEKTFTEQKWEELGGDWVMMSETRTKGEPLTLFAEPPKK
jgi:hypothetical protein